MDNLNENNLKREAESAEAEMDENAAGALGKFKDVKALLSAYESLEAEFTRRSQRLKELENAVKPVSPSENEGNGEAAPQSAEIPNLYEGEEFISAALSNQSVRDAVIGEYLKSVATNKGVPLITGGNAVASPRVQVSSVREAGKLAREFLFTKH